MAEAPGWPPAHSQPGWSHACVQLESLPARSRSRGRSPRGRSRPRAPQPPAELHSVVSRGQGSGPQGGVLRVRWGQAPVVYHGPHPRKGTGSPCPRHGAWWPGPRPGSAAGEPGPMGPRARSPQGPEAAPQAHCPSLGPPAAWARPAGSWSQPLAKASREGVPGASTWATSCVQTPGSAHQGSRVPSLRGPGLLPAPGLDTGNIPAQAPLRGR